MAPPRSRVLLDQAALAEGLDALAGRLKERLDGREVTAVPVLGGGMFFAADLVRRLPAGLVMDFIRIRTYGDATSPQKAPKADWLPHPENIEGRTVLLLDDILDTGRTLQEARRIMSDAMAPSTQIRIFPHPGGRISRFSTKIGKIGPRPRPAT